MLNRLTPLELYTLEYMEATQIWENGEELLIFFYYDQYVKIVQNWKLVCSFLNKLRLSIF